MLLVLQLRRWVNRTSFLAFSTWVELLRDNLLMRTALRRALNRGLALAFNRWAELAEEKARLRLVAERVMRRMLSRCQAGAFDGWYAAVREVVDAREARLRHAVIQMHLAVVQRCFVAWADSCVGVEQQRERRARQILGRIRNRALVICMEAWIETTKKALHLKAYYAARWANILLAKLFLAWQRTAHREASIRLRTRAMVIRMARRTEVLVLQEWHHYVREARSLLRVAVARWVNEQLSAGFDTWSDFAAERRRMVQLGRLVLGRYANSLLAKCVLAWCTFAADAAESRARTTSQALAFLSGRQELILRGRFDAWWALVLAARQKRENAKRGVISRVRNRVVAMAWNMWMDHHLEFQRARRSLQHMVAGALAKAWRTWEAYARGRARMQHLARVMIGRYRNGLLARVLYGWAAYARSTGHQRRESTLKALALISGKRETLLLYRFKGWKEWAAQQAARKRELVGKAFSRYSNQLTTKCFMAWSIFVHRARQELDGKMLRALAFLSNKEQVLLKLAFQALKRAIAAREDEREALVGKALMRMRYGILHLAFSTWRELVEEASRARRISSSIHPEVAALRERVRDLEDLVEERMPGRLSAAAPADAPAAEPSDPRDNMATFDLAPLIDTLVGYGKTMHHALSALNGLAEGLSETRLAAQIGGGGGGGRGGYAAGGGQLVGSFSAANSRALANDFVRDRLEEMEGQLLQQIDAASSELRGAELRLAESLAQVQESKHLRARDTIDVPLHPLPMWSLDKSSGATLRAELAWTQQQLASTRRELRDTARSKAYRYELAYMRNELHSFLFRGGAPVPPPDMSSALGMMDGASPPRSANTSRATSPPPHPPPSRASSSRPQSADQRRRMGGAAATTVVKVPSVASNDWEAEERGGEGGRAPLAASDPTTNLADADPGAQGGRSGNGSAARCVTTQYGLGVGAGGEPAGSAPTAIGSSSFPRRPINPAVASAAIASAEVSAATQLHSARACGRGPAPPNRARPRSAGARASPRMRHLGAGGGEVGAEAAPPSSMEVSGWASRSHFAQMPGFV